MIDKLVRYVRKRVQWARCARALRGVHTVTEFHRFLQRTRMLAPYVTDAPEVSQQKRAAIAATLIAYDVQVTGRRVLDIGPGYGDFLDVCRERGALTVGLDHDPLVVRWLQLRGHIALRGNVLHSLKPLHAQPFDLINSTGSIIVEYFSLVGLGRLRRLLVRLEEHLAPGGRILICPYFEHGPGRVRKIRDPLNCPFTDTMRSAGYAVLPRIPGVHDDHMYTLTYGKQRPPANAT